MAKALKGFRERAGFTRRALASAIGTTTEQVRWWETSAALPDTDQFERLADAVGVREDELLLAEGHLPDWLREACRTSGPQVLDALETIRPGVEQQGQLRPSLDDLTPTLRTDLGTLYSADCLDVLPAVESRSVDCVFADPPFNLGKDYGGKVDDARAEEQYLRWCFRWLDELVRVLKPGGALFLYNLPRWNLHLAEHLSCSMTFKHWIAVDIKFSLPISGRLYPSHYALLYFVKGPKARVFHPSRLPLQTCRHCGGEIKDYGGYKNKMNPRGVNLTDVWTDIPPVRHRRYKNRNANELALKMLDRVLDIATDPGDLVLDPFGGGGTTYAACELRGRRWIGIELGECQPIVERLDHLEGERDQLEGIREKINVLFTRSALSLRRRFGHDTSKYRVDTTRGEREEGERNSRTSTRTQGSLFGGADDERRR